MDTHAIAATYAWYIGASPMTARQNQCEYRTSGDSPLTIEGLYGPVMHVLVHISAVWALISHISVSIRTLLVPHRPAKRW